MYTPLAIDDVDNCKTLSIKSINIDFLDVMLNLCLAFQSIPLDPHIVPKSYQCLRRSDWCCWPSIDQTPCVKMSVNSPEECFRIYLLTPVTTSSNKACHNQYDEWKTNFIFKIFRTKKMRKMYLLKEPKNYNYNLTNRWLFWNIKQQWHKNKVNKLHSDQHKIYKYSLRSLNPRHL